MTANVLVISTSLNPESNSRIMAQKAFEVLSKNGSAEFVDLREHPLPICDGDAAYGHENVAKLTKKIKAAQAILLAVPVYNYSFSSSAKNLIELTGRAWTDKVVGFLCAAGGKSSYMSIMSLANSLMLDFRCLINPRFVYTDGSVFDEGTINDSELITRVEELATSTLALAGRTADSLK
jgi:NAD(P)H-dependent FMN reductase